MSYDCADEGNRKTLSVIWCGAPETPLEVIYCTVNTTGNASVSQPSYLKDFATLTEGDCVEVFGKDLQRLDLLSDDQHPQFSEEARLFKIVYASLFPSII